MDNTTPFQPWAVDDSVKNVKSDRELVDDAKLRQENVNHPKHTQTASYDKEAVTNPSDSPGPSRPLGPGEQFNRAKDIKMDPSKIASMQQIVENTISPEGRQRVTQLLEAVEALSGAERLLLYLRLPTGVPPHDPLKQPINPLGSRAELQQTVTWIQTHLEVDPDVSLPKQDVYDEYIAHCMSSNMKPLSTADFGKVMKQVYPTVRPRRLGTRGNSRYCYAGLRKKIKLEVPQLPDLGESLKELRTTSRESERLVCDWAESKLGVKVGSISELARLVAAGSLTATGSLTAAGPSHSPPAHHGSTEEASSRQLMKHLKRKIQGQGTPGRPKKNKSSEAESPPAVAPPPPPPEPWGAPASVPPPAAPPRAHYREGWPYSELVPMPMNLSSDVSLDLRRRPPLPGKKMILEAYQSERALSPSRAPPPPPPQQPHYLPKKMRAAESLGGKLAQREPPPPAPSAASASSASSASSAPMVPRIPTQHPAFLEDPKNLASRSTSRAAALAREHTAAASSGLSRERVISISGIDKHDLDDYLHEGSSQEHEEELLQYFQRREAEQSSAADPAPAPAPVPGNFLEAGADPTDDHTHNNEKISQLRELLEKNLKQGSEEAAAAAGGGARFEFVPISGAAASPFVSPRATPLPRPRHVPARRRRAPPLLPAPHLYCQPMSAPPSPNLLPHYKHFPPPPPHSQPLSADPLSSEVSQFFQDPLVSYGMADTFRSQSAPLKRGLHLCALSYNSTPAGSVPPTPVPNEFCDFGSLADTCDISRAGLNPETLDKIYDAIDSSSDVLGPDAAHMLAAPEPLANGCDALSNGCDALTNGCEALTNGCDTLTNGCDALNNGCDALTNGMTNGCEGLSNGCEGQMLTDEQLNSLLPSDEMNGFGRGRGGGRRRKVAPPPQLLDDAVFYNRDFLINGNSVEAFAAPLHSPLHDMMLEPLTPAADLLADLDKIDPPHYPDL